ncbi:MAG: hypothetical protein CMQ46_13945 [Gammaproteobacteria bacterium]|nr:hypothetical protein [Gammaproteobacteria bacterium]MBJ56353.1 hypothetical protein [Gammaproteobacteria bacterium]HBN15070.1 hypothetical protein [Pseudohongiella sp.]|tara:strand:+ start:1628 stop:2206 length:579 start_codon:yes stop_codon:yes gene_type:complete
MITFADSHVDLMGDVTFSQKQLIRRWDQELGKKWGQEVQDNLRDFMQIKASLNPETFPNYAANETLLAEFIADKQVCYERRIADEAKNALLISVIEYEQAVRRKAELELLINGREAVEEVPEETDPVTGEVTQEYVPAIEAVEPMAQTIDQEGETVDNPDYLAAVAELAECQAVIDGAGAEVLAHVAARSGQ